MEWTSSSPFVLSANLHGGSVVASYPYDDSDPKLNRTSVYSKSPDDLFFRDLATGYASRNPLMGSGNPHCPDKETFPGGVTNGADWYDVSGSMQDWNYVFTNTFEVTFELSCCKFPLANQLPLEWQRNRASMLWFTGQVHRGAKGVVKDNETLKPIHGAKVKIVGNTHHVVTSKRGEYWRLLMPGNYSLVVEADGFGSEVVGPDVPALDFVHHNYSSMQSWLQSACAARPEICALRYGKVDRVTKLLDETRIYIMPSMNPDGHEHAYEEYQRLRTSSLPRSDPTQIVLPGRANANGVDLNRDFPDDLIPRSVLAERQPETQAVMDWALSSHFVLSANFHGGFIVANYPYDACRNPYDVCLQSSYSVSPDDDLYRNISKVYAMANPRMGHVECQCGRDHECYPGGIVNGHVWYSVRGGLQDWSYLHTSDTHVTVEVSCDKFPPDETLESYWEDNEESMMAYIEQVHQGISGFVLDEATGSPIVSGASEDDQKRDIRIYVEGNDRSVGVSKAGEYFRLLLPGSYVIWAEDHTSG
ncbi:unnamed protein product [Cyprideis torosa]|uniref:Peptidase M14 domain-containing protein n=1 Tax=Cyprideis torosa TaxID=163714 RepID=A0A7R8WSK6_9CRUS|nr:unnamed protein product [Cyprideis torosa]CAG0903852.1 unnamed protein product [Cyprideis torosa]